MTSPDYAVIDWEGYSRYDELEDAGNATLDGRGFYFLVGTEYDERTRRVYEDTFFLLYIGQAYHQTIRVRAQQDHAAWGCANSYLRQNPESYVFLSAGTIIDSSLLRETPQFYDDIECCLILRNQPECNVPCKETYSGRDIHVFNQGKYDPLVERSDCLPSQA